MHSFLLRFRRWLLGYYCRSRLRGISRLSLQTRFFGHASSLTCHSHVVRHYQSFSCLSVFIYKNNMLIITINDAFNYIQIYIWKIIILQFITERLLFKNIIRSIDEIFIKRYLIRLNTQVYLILINNYIYLSSSYLLLM